MIPRLLLACAALALNPAVATAQQSRQDSVDAALPTQLPRTAIPRHYAINVTPNAQNLAFDGSVTVDLEVIRPTRTLVLNAADLAITSARLTRGKAAPLPGRITVDAGKQTATFDFGRTIVPGKYQLALAYRGKINTQANGLFALDYKTVEGKDARGLFTQFEAPDARRFVPSWDEPDYKATFDLTVRIPQAEMAVSNMPAAATQPVAGGLKEVRFQRSPVMSSYLLFLAVGDFERIAKRVGDREVGIVMPRGKSDQARYALDSEAQVLPYFDDYFGTPYPLPKLDNVAGPGQSQFFGAMENWGAIFTFERILLVDPAITSEADRQRIFSVQAHEMAHQWFGNLVTMGWWDDLWLNEGFASWMANRTVQHFHPEWAADIGQVEAREAAMVLDSFATTHPIVQPVRTVEQINQAFDAITYRKGESVIGMLEGFAGADVWRAGLRDYMKRHAYRNTRTSDLWAAVERAGAKGLIQVATDYTGKPGIPLITVGPSRCENGRTIADLTQGEFSSDRRAEVLARPLSWHVPVRATAGGAERQLVTSARTNRLEVAGCGPLLINRGQTGYYRTLYTDKDAQALRAAFPTLAPVDQFGVLTDGLELSRSGYQPMSRGLDLLAAVQGSSHPKLAGLAAAQWRTLHDEMIGDTAAQAKIRSRILQTFGPRLQQLGLGGRSGEPALDALLRTNLIATLGALGEPAVLAEANRLFAAFQTNPQAIEGPLKETWLRVIARNATPANWDALHAIARRTTGTVERTTLYNLLGAANDDALARRALDLAVTKEPGTTVSASMISAVAANKPDLALDFTLANLARVMPLIDSSASSRYVAGLASGSGDTAAIAKLNAYAAANLAAGDRKPIERSVARIRWTAETRPRIRTETAAWVQSL